MFRCDSCRRISRPNVRPNRVVTVQRLVRYITDFVDDLRGTRRRVIDSRVGFGKETVREESLCTRCARDSVTVLSATPEKTVRQVVQYIDHQRQFGGRFRSAA